jgi:D-alanyl-lipoteichoic acid acyltransferase DltB (MBOAT superfamily)
VTFVFYPLAAKGMLLLISRRHQVSVFAALNVAFVLALIIAQTAEGTPLSPARLTEFIEICVLVFLAYLAFAMINYTILRNGANRGEGHAWLAFLFPLLILCIAKYWPARMDPLNASLVELGNRHRSEFFVGISYMAFRLSRLLQEVRNGVVPQPSLAEYLAFAFFIPTMTLGPINAYSNMRPWLAGGPSVSTAPGWAWLRILIGLTKYLFLATILNQFTYSGLLLDGHPHARLDVVFAIPAYTLYLYCNFSGFCDMVIGVSALLGIEVSENFDRPFAARNLQEFWNAWHMTLSTWFRDMMFTPMLKVLVRKFGQTSINQMIAVTIVVVFLVLGIWHGTGLNFLIFGSLQALGVVTVHYHRLALKKVLSKEALATYHENRGIRLVGTVLTFAYFSVTLFFFANSIDDMHRIASAIV